MKNRKNEPMTKKEYITLMSIAIGLMVMFFAILFVTAALQDNGVSSEVYTPIGILSFAFIIAALVVLFANMHRVTDYEAGKIEKRIDETKFTIYEGFSESGMRAILEKDGFTFKDEYLYKRKFYIWKDYVNCFAKFSSGNSIQEISTKELATFRSKSYKNQNRCLMLFASVDSLSSEEMKRLKTISKAMIVNSLADKYSVLDMVVIFAIDRSAGKMYCLRSPWKLCTYAFGADFIDKLIKKSQQK